MPVQALTHALLNVGSLLAFLSLAPHTCQYTGSSIVASGLFSTLLQSISCVRELTVNHLASVVLAIMPSTIASDTTPKAIHSGTHPPPPSPWLPSSLSR